MELFSRWVLIRNSILFDPFFYSGVTFSEGWNTSSEWDSELVYEPCRVEGLKLTLSSSFLPSSG